MFQWIEIMTERLAAFGRLIAQVLIVYMMLHIMLEIMLRVFFRTSTYSMNEFVGYALAGMVFFGLAETFYQRRHVRVNLLIVALPPLGQRILDLSCLVATGLVMSGLTYVVWLTFQRNLERGSVSPSIMAVPTWIIDLVILTGLVLFLLQLVVTIIRTAISGMKPDATPLEG
ncbi:TRAP transporter small permease subunit [Chelativorans alearense]|uniref:TRAP transporter small permease subunit n=1 Tax=Chelativorans alearense TaxID=2681495 RepID=UPI0013D49A98|nr:TRAP transporter small permease [Chelativorans alearense]